jgi:nucleoid-associated protein YgaU
MERSISAYELYGRYSPQAAARMRVHTFKAGETISGLAFRYYGDSSSWRLIADYNHLPDVRRIEPGTQLLVPQVEPERGRYESL